MRLKKRVEILEETIRQQECEHAWELREVYSSSGIYWKVTGKCYLCNLQKTIVADEKEKKALEDLLQRMKEK